MSAEDGYEKLIAEPEKRNDNLVQVSDDLDTVHKKQAHEAQEKLELISRTNGRRIQRRKRSAIQSGDGKSWGRVC